MKYIIDQKRQYTYADYLTWWDDKRRELIDGRIRELLPSESVQHQEISSRISVGLMNFLEQEKSDCKVFVAPLDVRLPKKRGMPNDMIDTVVQPDIFVVCNPRKIDKKGIVGAPDMIVEIQSPSTGSYDLRTKYALYEREGVREYWIAYREEGIEVFILQPNKKYGEGRFYQEHETVPVHVLPGCEIKVKEIYQ